MKDFTKEELEINSIELDKQSKEYIKKVEKEQNRMEMAEELRFLLALPINDSIKAVSSVEAKSLKDIASNSSKTVQASILIALITRATQGDVKSIELITQLLGEHKLNNEITLKAENRSALINVYNQLKERGKDLE